MVCRQPPLDVIEPGLDPHLLFFQQFERDRTRIVRTQNDEPLLFQRGALLRQGFQLARVRRQQPIKLGVDHPRQRLAEVRGDLDRLVILLDHALDIFDKDRLPGATGLLRVASVAYEVWVDLALAVVRVHDDES
ncbi:MULTISPECIES: hypothetical protein [Microbacterium]|uniref:hypothetical protein n=1 Tax=Microbacterium TaxID=33882 RepID=UPI001E28F6C9|nr:MULTISPECIES: hypothetical protein [Microbacterium]